MASAALGRGNLVIVRAGDASLHPQWCAGARNRTWDLLISYYGNDPRIYRGADSLRVDTPGTKCRGLTELFRRERARISRYDYILLADDDLDWRADDINRLFEICAQYGLDLAQPSLTADSWFAHTSVVHNPLFRLRYTSYVEGMVTCLSQRGWRAIAHTFSENVSGFGIDYVWPHLIRSGRMAVIDAVQVRHTQPSGGPNIVAARKSGVVPEQEAIAVMKKYGVSSPRFRVVRGVTWTGIEVNAGPLLLILYALGLLLEARRMKRGWAPVPRILASAVWQQVRPMAPRDTSVPLPCGRDCE